ncbi:MAG: hypothetical protein C6P37_12745 [Caldibacillus debilis]|uniref:Uncharacterized protein n=1 Tax=Caldibacillus debilis TaxID=301148 RepID=A0A3E0K2H8_9BACI|nr:MAG: hypothetical protein C6P37_12745 [Caldibacillus debilis]REJ30578.1 MAG: hypothetical protein C6W56_02855 [Caldibacillus debilis]
MFFQKKRGSLWTSAKIFSSGQSCPFAPMMGRAGKRDPKGEFGRRDIRRMGRAGRFCAGEDPGREGARVKGRPNKDAERKQPAGPFRRTCGFGRPFSAVGGSFRKPEGGGIPARVHPVKLFFELS